MVWIQGVASSNTTTLRKPTSLDIAARAGVSQSTVSRALSGSPLVAGETRRKVLVAARELNYHVDHLASSFRSGSARTLALLLFEDATADDSNINPFFLRMIGSISRACTHRGYDLLLSFRQANMDLYAQYEATHRADGLILLGYGDYTHSRDSLRQLAESGAHFILWGPVIEGQPGVSVGCDNYKGGLVATRHLIDQGCRNIAFIGTSSDRAPEFKERHRGYLAALKKAGLSPPPNARVNAMSNEKAGSNGMGKILAALPEVDGVFCASDLIALGALNHLRHKGIEVPADIGIVGFDNIGAAAYCNPSLTTMHQDTDKAGQMVVETLLQMVHEGSAESQLLQPKLVQRESS